MFDKSFGLCLKQEWRRSASPNMQKIYFTFPLWLLTNRSCFIFCTEFFPVSFPMLILQNKKLSRQITVTFAHNGMTHQLSQKNLIKWSTYENLFNRNLLCVNSLFSPEWGTKCTSALLSSPYPNLMKALFTLGAAPPLFSSPWRNKGAWMGTHL